MRRSFVRPFASVAMPLTGVLLASLSGCARTPALAPAPTSIASPVVAPVPVVPLPARIAIARTVAERVYAVRSTATVERDSGGHSETQRIDTRATIALTIARAADGALRGTGRVDGFTVQLGGAGIVAPLPPSAASPVTMSVRKAAGDAFGPTLFDAALDATSLRVTVRPPLANECDRTEAGATTLVQQLLLRVPSTVLVGDTWRDSTSSVLCRVSMPITVRDVHDYAVQSIEGSGTAMSIRIRRTTATRLDGKVGTTWRTLELSGVGSGTDEFRVDATTGVVQSIDGQHTLTLQLSERGRSSAQRAQRVTQKTTLHAETPR